MSDELFQIELIGAKPLLDQLTLAILQLEHPHKLMEAIGSELEANVNLRFDTQTDAAGQKWKPLAESTKERYKEKYKGNVPGTLDRVLERSRLMRNSLAYNATDASVEVGMSAPYAVFHVTGTKHMPRRDPLFGWVSEDGTQGSLGAGDEADIQAIVEEFLAAPLA